MTPEKQLESLWSEGVKFLGSRYAILGGAMTWVSERHLVSALSNAGGFGVLACGAMPPEMLEAEIEATRKIPREAKMQRPNMPGRRPKESPRNRDLLLSFGGDIGFALESKSDIEQKFGHR